MTDITYLDRRSAREWATTMEKHGAVSPPIRAAARVILATVEAPALSEELANITETWEEWATETITEALANFTTRTAQMEHDLAEARAELNQWKLVSRIETTTLREQRDEAQADLADVTEVNHEIRRERDEARAEAILWEGKYEEVLESEQSLRIDLADADVEVEKLTAQNENLRRTDNYKEFKEQFLTVQKGAESNAESLDPADVKPGEAWIVDVDGERRTAVKDEGAPYPWNTVTAGGCLSPMGDEDVTLITRLVPAPHVITDPDELDRLPFRAVIVSMDRQADVYQKDSNGEWMDVTSYGHSSREVIRIENAVTVLWEGQE